MSRKRRTAPPIPGARPAPAPDFIQPCLATLRSDAPPGAEWVHEIKYDGYRLQMHVRGGQIRLFTRRGYDWIRFSPRARARFPIAARVTWREVERGIAPDALTLARPPRQVAERVGRPTA